MFKFPDGMHYGRFPRIGPSANRSKNGGPEGRSAFWVIAAIFLFAMALGADALWQGLEELGSGLFELLEESIERFFRKSMGMDFHQAQMAAAYLDATGALIITGLLARKAFRVWRRAREDGYLWLKTQRERSRSFLHYRVLVTRQWWDTLDWLNKVAVVIGALVVAVPAAMILSYGLGMAVSELL